MSKVIRQGAAVISAVLLVFASSAVAMAATSQNGQPMVILNPGGAALLDGSDGLRIILNGNDGPQAPEDGSDQVFWAQEDNWCCGGVGPVLAIGSTSYGEAGAARNRNLASWTSLAVSGLTGAYQEVATGTDPSPLSSSVGSAAAVLTYTKTVGGLSYVLQRSVNYTYPNNYYDETWTLTIPAGNTEVVKLYLGGDAAPGGSDEGIGSIATYGSLTSVREANPDSGQYIAYTEKNASSKFTHYFVGDYSDPYNTIASGGNLDDSIDTTSHDAGIQIQWTFGSSPGSFERQMRTTVGFNTDIDDNPVEDVQEEAPAVAEVKSDRLPRFDQVGTVLGGSQGDLVLTGQRLYCTSEVNVNGAKAAFTHEASALGNGTEKLTIKLPKLDPGFHQISMDSCGGFVTYDRFLYVPKAPAVMQGRVGNSLERANLMIRLQQWARENRSDYNSVECIVNTRSLSQENAKSLAKDMCSKTFGRLASPKSYVITIRENSSHVQIWYKVILSNQ